MNIATYIGRKTYYRNYGPLIEEMLKRGHHVYCFHDLIDAGDHQKSYDSPSLGSTPSFQNGKPSVVLIQQEGDFVDAVGRYAIHAILTLHFKPRYEQLRQQIQAQGHKVQWIALQHAADVLIFSDDLERADQILFYSDYWKDLTLKAFQGLPALRGEFAAKSSCIGITEIDQLSTIDPVAVKRLWGISQGKKVVLFMPFPFNSSVDRFWSRFIYGSRNRWLSSLIALGCFRGRWLRQIWSGENDRAVINSIRKFCDRNNAYLLLKARRKDPIPDYAALIADRVLYDEDTYPATVFQCLSVSDLLIHFGSNAAAEAAAKGIPNIAILPDEKDYKDHRTYRPWPSVKYMCTYKGVSYNLSIPEALASLPQAQISDFRLDPVALDQFISTFIAYADGHNSARACDAIERCVQTALGDKPKPELHTHAR